MLIQGTWDIAVARNVCRKAILDQKLPPTLCARVVAAIAALGELILLSHLTGTLEIHIVPQQGKRGVELTCCIPLADRQCPSLDTARSQLARVADALEIQNQDNRLIIIVQFWVSEAMPFPEVTPDE